jgi:hypothetical protein
MNTICYDIARRKTMSNDKPVSDQTQEKPLPRPTAEEQEERDNEIDELIESIVPSAVVDVSNNLQLMKKELQNPEKRELFRLLTNMFKEGRKHDK